MGSDNDFERSSRDTKKGKKEKDDCRSSDGDSDDSKRSHKKEVVTKDVNKLSKHSGSKDRKDENQKRPPKFFRDLKPECILGVTADVGDGELYFYIKWKDDQAEPGLVKAKEAYQKIPMMCLKFYEKHLVWNKVVSQPVTVKEDESKKG